MKRDGIMGNRCAGLLLFVFIAGVAGPVQGIAEKGGINRAKVESTYDKRDPFWPVGYVPERSIQITPQKSSANFSVNSWNEAMKKVVINGVSSRKGSEYFAVINGDVKRVGDTVSVRLGNSIYTWAVDGIETPGSVKLRRLSVRQG